VEINHVAKKETKPNVLQKVNRAANLAHRANANAALIVVKMVVANPKIASAKAHVVKNNYFL
jgi:hypothetical protein